MIRPTARTAALALALLCAAAAALRGVRRRQAERPGFTAALVIVDQLAAEDLDALWPRLPSDGFKALAGEGVRFSSARQEHGVTLTAPGHAALYSGVHGAANGIVGNAWFDAAAQARGECDGEACRVRAEEGGLADRAPRPGGGLRGPTVADALLAAHPRAVVIAVALKPRAAALVSRDPRALLYAYDESRGEFIPLTAAPGSAPAPVAPRPPAVAAAADWEESAGADPGEPDDAPWEQPPAGWERTFPHRLPAPGAAGRAELLPYLPSTAAAETDAALALAARERLGAAAPGLLVISYSGYDYVAHSFGRESREARDWLFRLDRQIARLRAALRARARAGWRIYLTSDHGSAESPERRIARLGEAAHAGRLDESAVRAVAERALTRAFGAPPAGRSWVADFEPPHLWLDRRALGRRLSAAEEIVQYALQRTDHVAGAWLRDGVCAQDDATARLLCADADPERAGDVLVEPSPGWLWGTDVATSHGTPHEYDRAVPLLIAPLPAAARPDGALRPDVACVAASLARDFGLAAPRPGMIVPCPGT